MLLVVDANIVCSALVGGRLTDLFLSQKLKLVAPELIFEELKKHKEELKQKSKLSEEEFEILLAILERRIKIIPMDEFVDLFDEAEEILEEHIKDAPYVALALKLKCSFWTYEKRLLRTKKIKSLTTEEVAKEIKQFFI
ncbi:hypothetical protein HZA97_08245 [Candidatus Woesearchaeota archaeon]|nr:hypothetical protein [Candidatus Woesearchaeota archaeon]